jgi:hypothetical protein
LHAKYNEGRSGKGVFTYIEGRAERANIRSCPYCGRGGVGTIDHYLPQEHFAWFSVYSWNLVPACQECQNIKAAKIGAAGQWRPIHPLLDRVGFSQSLHIRVHFHGPDVMLTTFDFALTENRSFNRKVRKREKHLFQRHWNFFGRERQDVLSACRTALTDIRAGLYVDLEDSTDVDLDAVRWIRRRLRRALRFEDLASDNLLTVGLLRELNSEKALLRSLLSTRVPTKALTSRQQHALLRAR